MVHYSGWLQNCSQGIAWSHSWPGLRDTQLMHTIGGTGSIFHTLLVLVFHRSMHRHPSDSCRLHPLIPRYSPARACHGYSMILQYDTAPLPIHNVAIGFPHSCLGAGWPQPCPFSSFAAAYQLEAPVLPHQTVVGNVASGCCWFLAVAIRKHRSEPCNSKRI